MNYYQMPNDEVLKSLNSNKTGLSMEDVKKQREIYGSNLLEDAKTNEEQHDFVKSFYIVAIRNTIGAFIGGAQTGSLWRSFNTTLYDETSF